MRRALLPLLLALALLAPAVVASAQGNRDRADDDDDAANGGRPASPQNPTAQERASGANGGAPGRSDDDSDSDDDDDADDDARPGNGNGPRPQDLPGPAIGAFEVRSAEREVVGAFLNFSYNDTGLHSYAFGGMTLFNATVTPDPERDDDKRTHTETVARGAQIRVRTPAFTLQAHDNPGAVTKIDTDGRVTLHFAPSVNVTLLEDGRARFVVDGVAGTVRGDDLELADGELRAREGVLVFLDAPRGSFDRHREELGEAIAKRAVGAEMSIVKREDAVEEDAVSYGNVTLTTLKAESGNFTVLIDGHGFDGRVLVFNIDGRVLGAQRAEDLEIKFDNATIRAASNLTDILDPDDDGLEPEYYLVFDPQTQAFQLIVTVPHYSVHVLSVGTFVIPVKPSVVVGVLAGVALLGPAGYVLFRRR